MRKTVLILGGGWGGLTAAHSLRSLLPSDYRVAVIEKRQSFVFYPSYLKVLTGETKGIEYLESPMKDLLKKDLEIIQEEVIRIDPVRKVIHTNAQRIEADYIIIALGAELYPGMIPGFTSHCVNLYDTVGAFEIHRKLKQITSGKIAFLVTRTPFRCPPAPYEAALLTEYFLRKREVRKDFDISIYTPEKFPMPSAGEQVGDTFKQILTSHAIHFFSEHSVSRIEKGKMIFSNNKEAVYDLLIGIPPHGAPKAIVDSGLTNASGYIPVHPQTMEILDNVEELTTRYPGIYAIGDAAGVLLLNGKYLPKGGVFAEEEAHVVARNIVSGISGEKPASNFKGHGVCYVDVGDEMAAEGSGDFYAYPDPVVKLQMPSIESRKAKHEFERIFEWWFTEYQQK